MERIIEKMNYEIESCENRIDDEEDELQKLLINERMKTIKEFKHHLEFELDFEKGMGSDFQILKYNRALNLISA